MELAQNARRGVLELSFELRENILLYNDLLVILEISLLQMKDLVELDLVALFLNLLFVTFCGLLELGFFVV